MNRYPWQKAINALLLIVCLACLGGHSIQADVVVLTTGERFNSSRIWEEDGKIRFDLQGLIVSIKKTDVAEIIRDDIALKVTQSPKNTIPRLSSEQAGASSPLDGSQTNTPTSPSARQKPPPQTVAIHGPGIDGLSWQMKPSQIPGIKKLNTDPAYGGIDQYWRPKETLTFGEVVLDGLVFGFWHDRLYTIMIWVNGKPGYNRLHEAVIQRYGQGTRNPNGFERYVWIDDTSDRLLEFDEKLNTGIFWLRSRELDQYVRQTHPNE